MSSNSKQFILLVDADVANQKSIEHTLRNLNVEVVVVESTEAVADLILVYDFALIIFAIDSVDPKPIEVAVELNLNEKTWFVPIIFQAHPEEEGLLEQCYAAGGIDFLIKPLHPAIFLAKVKVFLELDERQQQLASATIKIHEQNLKLEERAIRDSLTGLYNHNHLLELLAREVSMGKRYDTPLSVFLLDLDFFKDVNDTCGHPFGDFVLQEFSDRVKESLRQSDIFGRYGGEEFMVILPNTGAEQAGVVAEKIRDSIASIPFSNKRYERYVTVSIGLYSGFGEEIVNSRALVDYVDNALYQAKAEGRNRVVHYRQASGVALDGSNAHLHDMIDLSQQSRLNATIEKARAMTLASFEAMVHSQTREYDILVDRNAFFTKVLDQLAKQLNLPDKLIHSFRRAIKLHDLFRCYIHDSSLETKGPLSKEQKDMLFDQPLMLRELTTMFDFFALERVILYAHHEHYDGSGYPDGLKEHEIPLAARIFSLIDAFVAMVAPVAGEERKTIEDAMEELRACSGSQFDPVLVKTLLKTLEEANGQGIKRRGGMNATKG